MTLGITRSLADFAKLVELFDAHGVSFNWVAQAFNTTTSMGRLTLNVLLSFAQFEREITGERIRDKAAASKRKGIWMGGAVPLGYRVQDRPLQPVEGEAEFVRALFRRYLEIGRVVKLKTALDSENVHSPTRMSRRAKGQAPHRSREAISNGSCRTRFMSDGYATKGGFTTGFIRRSRTLRPGTGFSTSSRAKRRQGEHPVQMISPSARGKLYDDRGNRMGASHATKGGRRWRNYVSRGAVGTQAGLRAGGPRPRLRDRDPCCQRSRCSSCSCNDRATRPQP
jgi:site-specific DNA recombinase